MSGKLSRLPRAEQWADRICAQLGKAVESIIETGRLLMKAKDDLPHGEWMRMFDDQMIPLGLATAERFMKVARHPLISKSANWPTLPPAWRTLYDLSKVPDPFLQNAFTDGLIKPDMLGRDVKALFPPKPAPDAEPFHWLNAVGDLREVVEKTIAKWPAEARALAPKALRDLAEILEGESDAGRGDWNDSAGTRGDRHATHGAASPS